MTLAYYVFTILALGDMQTASTMFKYFILLQFPIYMISKYCIQKGLKTTILYIGLYYFMTIIMVNPSFLENLENRDAIIDSTFCTTRSHGLIYKNCPSGISNLNF